MLAILHTADFVLLGACFGLIAAPFIWNYASWETMGKMVAYFFGFLITLSAISALIIGEIIGALIILVVAFAALAYSGTRSSH